jgi:hypothetical protein
MITERRKKPTKKGKIGNLKQGSRERQEEGKIRKGATERRKVKRQKEKREPITVPVWSKA